MYYTHPCYQTSNFGKNCAYYIRIFTVTVDDVWQIADVGDQERQRLARNIRQGNLELGAEDNDGLSQPACTAHAGE